MIAYISFLLFCMVPLCQAMNSDVDEYVPGDKRMRVPANTPDYSCSSDQEDSIKKTRVAGQKSVQKSKFFSVNPCDTSKLLSNVDRSALIKTWLRKLLKTKGFTLPAVTQQIQEHWQVQDIEGLREEKQQDEDELKQFCMQCPDCDAIMQSDKDEKLVIKHVFRHWFLCRQHQPQLWDHAGELVAKTEIEARSNFKKNGLPNVAVVPLPQLHFADQEVEPMDEDDDEVVLDDEQEEPEQAASWYIVDSDVAQQHMVHVFTGASRHAVVIRYLSQKMPLLTTDCPEVHEQGILFTHNEEVMKQLMVQDNKARKKIVCPHQACDALFEQKGDVSEESLSRLFKNMAFHHMTTHPLEDDGVLVQNASKLAATSFDKAYALMHKN